MRTSLRVIFENMLTVMENNPALWCEVEKYVDFHVAIRRARAVRAIGIVESVVRSTAQHHGLIKLVALEVDIEAVALDIFSPLACNRLCQQLGASQLEGVDRLILRSGCSLREPPVDGVIDLVATGKCSGIATGSGRMRSRLYMLPHPAPPFSSTR